MTIVIFPSKTARVGARRAWPLACALSLAIVAGEQPALANGRFPRAQRLREARGEASTLVLAATYGLLVTHDRGGEWRHVCELGYAFSIDEIDPLVELVPDGALLVNAAHSLNRAPAPFCEFAPVLGGAGTETVVDYALDGSDRSHVVAVLMRSAAGDVTNELHESFDAGLTFAPIGAPLPADVDFAVTLDLAPSEPSRVYLTALGTDAPGLFVRSDDGGASFSSAPLPVAAEEYPYLAGVHPGNPDLAYVRTDRYVLDDDGDASASDALFVTEDGGSSFREVLRLRAKLLAFALSPDGSEIVVGYGDLVESSRVVDPPALGIYRASTSEHVFTKIYDGAVSCLEWTETGLYACTSQNERGFALGFAPDASFSLDDETPLEPLLDLEAVKGPLECPAGSSAAACGERWPDDCALFAACDGGAPGSAGAGTAGSGGSRAELDGSDSSCGCRTPSGRAALGGYAAAWLAAVALARRRATREACRAACGARPARRGASGTKRRDRARDRS